MIEKIEKLIEAMTTAAEEATQYYRRENGREYQPPLLPVSAAEMKVRPGGVIRMEEAQAVPVDAPAAPVSKPKRTRRTKEQIAADATAVGDDKGGAANEAMDIDLGAPPAPPLPPEMTEAESAVAVMDITKKFVILCQNDKPEDGKVRAKRWLAEMGVEGLAKMNHKHRLVWMAKMEQEIAGHK